MVYRHHPGSGIVVMLMGAVVLALAVYCGCIADAETEGARLFATSFCVVLGLVFGVAGYDLWAQRIVVDSRALRTFGPFSNQTVPWSCVHFWAIHANEPPCARFYAADNSELVSISECETCNPGFQKFLEKVRACAGSKERDALAHLHHQPNRDAHSLERTEFWSSRLLGGVFAFAGLPFTLIGGGALAVGLIEGQAWQDWGGCLFFSVVLLVGLLCTLGGLAMMSFRLVVDRDGIARMSWFGLVTYRDSWHSLKSWTTGKIADKEIPDRYFVEFDFAGRRWPVRIEASMVGNPGFHTFLNKIRLHAGSKEKLHAAVEGETPD